MFAHFRHVIFEESDKPISIPEGCFSAVSKLRVVEIHRPSVIEEEAFAGSWVNLVIFGKRTEISGLAFEKCYGLDHVKIPANSIVDEDAFEYTLIRHYSVDEGTTDANENILCPDRLIEFPLQVPFTISDCEVGKSFDAPSVASVLGHTTESSDTKPLETAIIALGVVSGVLTLTLVVLLLKRGASSRGVKSVSLP